MLVPNEYQFDIKKLENQIKKKNVIRGVDGANDKGTANKTVTKNGLHTREQQKIIEFEKKEQKPTN